VLAQEQDLVQFDDELELDMESAPELSVDLLASLVDSYGASHVIVREPTGTSSSSTTSSKPKGDCPQPITESIRNSRVLQDDVISTEPCPPHSAADGDGSRPTPQPDTAASAQLAATVTPGPYTQAVGDDGSTEAINYLVSDVSSSAPAQVDAEPSPSLSPLLLSELETPAPLLAVPRLDVTQHKTRRVRRPKHDLKILGHHDDASSDDACTVTPGIKPRSTLTASLKRRRVLDNACVSTAVSP
jgi:hypothetical protein